MFIFWEYIIRGAKSIILGKKDARLEKKIFIWRISMPMLRKSYPFREYCFFFRENDLNKDQKVYLKVKSFFCRKNRFNSAYLGFKLHCQFNLFRKAYS